MAKIEKFPLTNEMMHEAEDINDELRAERFRYPKICPKCGSDNLTAEVPHVDYIRYELVDGEWVDIDENEIGGDWDAAKYHCKDCDEDFEASNENGWAVETRDLQQRLNMNGDE
ncbi:MAG: hypothetical protein FVQ82_02890 [Planctomycetes bacterium]|nr:hypothetical protein [Planctomycetota bacterium]